MPSNIDHEKPPVADLNALLDGLVASGVEFILVGGLAAVAQGAPITTMDADIVHRQTPDNVNRLLTFLRSVDARHRRPDDKIIEPEERDLIGPGHALLATRFGPLDVLGAIEQGRGYDELMADAEEINFRGRKMRILNLETLVALKRLSKAPRDRHLLPILEEVLRQSRGE